MGGVLSQQGFPFNRENGNAPVHSVYGHDVAGILAKEGTYDAGRKV
jgi:hypothetical protein